MKENALEKRSPSAVKERGQYAVGFGVVALMLYYVGFPVFLLAFLGILSFFIWKVFTTESRTETRRIFEFYLAANEILRDDDRRWYGFEIQETIALGEAVVRSMNSPPPLVLFGLGWLYQKLGDHGSAVKNLEKVIDEPNVSEAAIISPSKDLREYVQMLRKIERFPAEAPMTSSAIRSLERGRKNRGSEILEYSRRQVEMAGLPLTQGESVTGIDFDKEEVLKVDEAFSEVQLDGSIEIGTGSELSDLPFGTKPKFANWLETANKNSDAEDGHRKTISEVLHDIYDKNIQ